MTSNIRDWSNLKSAPFRNGTIHLHTKKCEATLHLKVNFRGPLLFGCMVFTNTHWKKKNYSTGLCESNNNYFCCYFHRQDVYVYGEEAVFLCNDGYRLRGPDKRKCFSPLGLDIGRWSGFTPYCERK